jgi:DNA replication protein DnaC
VNPFDKYLQTARTVSEAESKAADARHRRLTRPPREPSLPLIYRSATVKSALRTQALEVVRRWLDLPEQQDLPADVSKRLAGGYRRGSCLVLCGPPGVGKTYAAAAAENHVQDQDREWFTTPVLLQDAFGKGGDAVREAVQTVHLVVLDDLGSEYVKAGGAREELLKTVFVVREQSRRPTIATLNKRPDQLGDFCDPIRSRIEGTWGIVVPCWGPDLRLEERRRRDLE